MTTKASGHPDETILTRNNEWYWLDLENKEHGPYNKEKSAIEMQSLYAKHITGELKLEVISAKEWEENLDKEKENSIHPCDYPAPWDCMCRGACSCHWVQKDR